MDDKEVIKEYLNRIHLDALWSSEIASILENGFVSDRYKACFHLKWTECGHRIREQVADDQKLELALAAALPMYEGGWCYALSG